MSPIVTVLMPARNAALHIREAVASLQRQSSSRWRLLLIDDASTDGTVGTVAALGDERINILQLAKHGGISKALNVGLEKVETEFVARLDADDVAHPTRFSKQLELFSNNEVSLVGTWWRAFGDTTLVGTPPTDHHALVEELAFRNPFAHSSVMIRTSALLDNQLHYREEFEPSEDYHLWVELSRISQIGIVPQFLTYRRVHSTQVSRAPGQQKLQLRKNRLIRREASRALDVWFPRPIKPGPLFLWYGVHLILGNRRSPPFRRSGVPIRRHILNEFWTETQKMAKILLFKTKLWEQFKLSRHQSKSGRYVELKNLTRTDQISSD